MSDNPQTPNPEPPEQPDTNPELQRQPAEADAHAEPHQEPPAPGPDARTSTGPQAGRAPADEGQHAQTAPLAGSPDVATRRSANPGIVVGALLVGALIGGLSGAGVAAWAIGSADDSAVAPPPATVTVNDPDDVNAITAAVAKVAPSTVTIFVSAREARGSGSGVVIDDEGHILTNSHVVTLDGAADDPQVRVQTYDGRLLEAEIVGTDPIADLAVIQVDPDAGLPAAEFADSSDVNVGDRAIALGAPLGLSNSVSSGIVSALNRSISIASSAVPDESDLQPTPPEDGFPGPFDFWDFDIPGQERRQAPSSRITIVVMQTDAAINPGNSGGPLVDDDGRIIGINVAIASPGNGAEGNIGVGFAIPGNIAERISTELIEHGSASHGLLGALVLDVTADPQQRDVGTVGASIQEVTEGGAADAAGIRAGDIITRFAGQPITSSADLTGQVRAMPAGAEAEVVFVRDGDTHTVEVTLGALE